MQVACAAGTRRAASLGVAPSHARPVPLLAGARRSSSALSLPACLSFAAAVAVIVVAVTVVAVIVVIEQGALKVVMRSVRRHCCGCQLRCKLCRLTRVRCAGRRAAPSANRPRAAAAASTAASASAAPAASGG